MNQKQHILEQFPRDIEAIVAELGMPQFATKQILSWVYEKGVDSFDAMTNISNTTVMHSQSVYFFAGRTKSSKQ